MKLYERGSGKRLAGLLAALLILLVVYALRPPVTYIPAQADPQTMYRVTWQVVGENFFDQHKLEHWRQWEHKYDGLLKTQEDAEKAIAEMLAALDDPYTYLLGKPEASAERENIRGSFVGVGIVLYPQVDKSTGQPLMAPDGAVLPATSADGYVVIQQVMEGGPAEKGGLKGGDEIVAVTQILEDGREGKTTPVKGLSLKAVAEKIRGPQGSPVKLTLRRLDRTFTVILERQPVKIQVVSHKRLEGGLGYIRIRDFESDDLIAQLVTAVGLLRDSKGLVVDLRNNPGGQVANAIVSAQVFLERGFVTTTKQRMSGYLVETQYALTADEMVVHTLVGEDSDLDHDRRLIKQMTRVPVVLLVNEHTASAAEMFAGALQDNGRALVVGAKTFGKGIGQSLIAMPNGTTLHVTSLRYYTPKMRWVGDATGGLFANGIVPDFTVPAKRAPGVDDQLEAGVERLKLIVALVK